MAKLQEMWENTGSMEIGRKMQALEWIEGALAMGGRASKAAAARRFGQQDEVGARLSRIRKERSLSQTELAERVGVIRRVVSHYETGHTRVPAEILFKLADVLNVSVYKLLGRTTKPPSAPKNKNSGSSSNISNPCHPATSAHSSAPSTPISSERRRND